MQLQPTEALLDLMGGGAESGAHEDTTAVAALVPLLLPPPAGLPVADAAYAPSALVGDTRGPALAAVAT